jgi:hypothetical protein
MSGGELDFVQWRIFQAAEDIQVYIDTNNIPNDWGNVRNYSDKTLAQFKECIKLLKVVGTMVMCIDYLLAGDYGEDTFHSKLASDLNKLSHEDIK